MNIWTWQRVSSSSLAAGSRGGHALWDSREPEQSSGWRSRFETLMRWTWGLYWLFYTILMTSGFAVSREQNPPPFRKPGNRRFWALSGRSPNCTNSSRLPFSVVPWPWKVWKGRLPRPWWKRMMKKRFRTASLTSSRCGCLCLFEHVFMAFA